MSDDLGNLVGSAEETAWLEMADAVEKTGNVPDGVSLESHPENAGEDISSGTAGESVSVTDSESGTGENFSGDSGESGAEDNSKWVDDLLNSIPDVDGTDTVESASISDNDAGNTASGSESSSVLDRAAILEKTKELLKSDEKGRELLDLYDDDDLNAHLEIALKLQEAMGGRAKKEDNTILQRLENVERLTKKAQEEENRQRVAEWNAAISKEVPEWENIIMKDRRFKGWFNQQSQLYKDCLQKASAPSDVVEALKKFQRDMGIADTRMNQYRGLYGNPANDTNVTKNIGLGNQQMSQQEMWMRISEDVENGRY